MPFSIHTFFSYGLPFPFIPLYRSRLLNPPRSKTTTMRRESLCEQETAELQTITSRSDLSEDLADLAHRRGEKNDRNRKEMAERTERSGFSDTIPWNIIQNHLNLHKIV